MAALGLVRTMLVVVAKLLEETEQVNRLQAANLTNEVAQVATRAARAAEAPGTHHDRARRCGTRLLRRWRGDPIHTEEGGPQAQRR